MQQFNFILQCHLRSTLSLHKAECMIQLWHIFGTSQGVELNAENSDVL